MRIDVKAVLQEPRAPSEDGERLAEYVRANSFPLGELELDVREVAPETLVSSFVNGFFHTLEQAGASIAEAIGITWITVYDSEAKRLGDFTQLFVEDALGDNMVATIDQRMVGEGIDV